MRSAAQIRPTITSKPVAAFPINLRPTHDTAPATRNACELCALNGICLPAGLIGKIPGDSSALVFHRKRLHAGQALYRTGEAFQHIYFVKTGSLKSVVLTGDGREQVTGFHFAGDVLGVDAICSPTHPSEAIALEETHVCSASFPQLVRTSRHLEQLQVHLLRLLSREVVRDQNAMLVLGRMQAEERVAAFLINVSQRFKARGCSPLEFTMPMAREEIGNYLGLAHETISRCLSRLKAARVLEVENRRIRILNMDGLRQFVGGPDVSRCGAAHSPVQ